MITPVETEIPQSNALVEATPDSLAELLSRDPEGYSKQDRGRIIEALRAQRIKWQESEASGPKPRRASATVALTSTATSTAEDLGL